MAYDHHEKAGNQGDIVKHPALIAALDATVSRAKGEPFRYADIFAAYAVNPLLKGNQWTRGISVVAGQHLLTGNRHVASWARWFSLDREPVEGGTS